MTTSQISDCRRGIPSVRTERNAVWCWYSRPCPTSFAHLGFRPTTPPSRLPEKIDLWSRMLPKQVRFGGQVSDICQLSGCTRAPSLRVVVQLRVLAMMWMSTHKPFTNPDTLWARTLFGKMESCFFEIRCSKDSRGGRKDVRESHRIMRWTAARIPFLCWAPSESWPESSERRVAWQSYSWAKSARLNLWSHEKARGQFLWGKPILDYILKS